jgi:hypothetical protein
MSLACIERVQFSILKAQKKHQRNIDSKKLTNAKPEKTGWGKWLEHWETWNAIVAEVKPPQCGLFGCDEKVKVGEKWKCVVCGKITDTAA